MVGAVCVFLKKNYIYKKHPWKMFEMHPVSVVLPSVLLSFVGASWIADLTSSKGLNFGDGVSLKMEDTEAKNSSFLERLALRVDNENVGVSMARNAEKEAVELDFYVKDRVEGENSQLLLMMTLQHGTTIRLSCCIKGFISHSSTL